MNYKWIIALLIGVFAQNIDAQTLFVEADYVQNRIGKEGYSIIDFRKPEAYQEDHVIGAVNIWRSDIEDSAYAYGGMMAEPTQVETLLSGLGVSSDDTLIIYDDRALCEAARFWWMLKVYGFEKVKLLNGGYATWLARGHIRTTEVESIVPTEFKLDSSSFNFGIHANLDEMEGWVKRALENGQIKILDTRTEDEFNGEIQKDGAYGKGHIPGAVWLDWSVFVNYRTDQRLKSISDIKKVTDSLDLNPDDTVIVYCHSGVRSAHTSMVLTEMLGFKNVVNYDGSWIETSYHYPEIGEETHEEVAEIEQVIKPFDFERYWEVFKSSFGAFASYTWNEITFNVTPWYVNYFWWLIALSLLVWLLEIIFPWRKNQPIIRKDFWLDAFYMFFNFYIFKIIIFMSFSNFTEAVFTDVVGGDIKRWALFDISGLNWWLQLVIFFVATDFIQWFTHVLLHRFDILWRFHKVHHSVEQMGFAAHLRYHWMENVFYTPMKYLMVMLIGGFTPDQAYIVFYIAIAIGHLNHANINLTYGPLKYLINNPAMHIWHHAYSLPEDRRHGINFGISLSIWDYIFRTAHIPESGRDIKLGFPKIESFPKGFFGQLFYGFRRKD